MITWQQLLMILPIAGLILATGRLLERIGSLRADLDAHKKAQAASARDQGRRIGNLESFTGLTADGIPVERLGGFTGRHRLPEEKDE